MLGADLRHLGGAHRVAMGPSDGLVPGHAGIEQPGEDPTREVVRIDLRHELQAPQRQIILDRRGQKLGPVVERLGISLCALDELDLILGRDPDIEDQAVASQTDR